MATGERRLGRSFQTASTGLLSTAINSPPALPQPRPAARLPRRVQPRVEAEAVPGQRCSPASPAGWIGQRLGVTGLAVDLLGGLQRVAAVDEERRPRRRARSPCRPAGEAGQPGQPLFRGRDILVLLLIGAGITKPVSLRRASSSRRCQAAPSAPRRSRVLRMSGNGLRTSPGHFRVGWSRPQCGGVATIWHNPCFNISVRASRMEQFAHAGRSAKHTGRLPGVFQLNEEGMHDACFHV